jgi:uncharacterized protein
MSLLARLQEDMRAAMKSGNKDRLSVIRMLIADVKTIDLKPEKPTEEQAVAAYGKKLQKAAAELEKLGRPDDAAKLRSELAVVEEYLPKKATGGDLEILVDAFLAGSSFTEKQFGQAMGAFMKQHGQNVDAAAVNALLRQRLAGR